MSARAAALDALVAYETGGVWSQTRFMAMLAKLDKRDAAFCSHLTHGVVQYKLLLDHHLAALSKIPLKKLETRVLCQLRLGAFQIIFSGGVRDAAAVNETVALTPNSRTRGFVNAVLRALTRINDPLGITAPTEPERLSVRYSTPRWIVGELIRTLGGTAEAEAELAAAHEPPPVTLRVNTSRTTAAALAAALEADGAQVEAGALPDTLHVRGIGDIERLKPFADGWFWVQDVSSLTAVAALGITDGANVIDVCAAPGGKSFAAYLSAKNVRITVCDISAKKVDIMRNSAARLGISLTARVADASVPNPAFDGAFDFVICDVPCSGLGIIRKKPDIKYKDRASVEALPAFQLAIASNAARFLKPGGRMLYSTCTWRREENEENVTKLIDTDPSLRIIDGPRTLWTSKDATDGFFICVLEKKDV